MTVPFNKLTAAVSGLVDRQHTDLSVGAPVRPRTVLADDPVRQWWPLDVEVSGGNRIITMTGGLLLYMHEGGGLVVRYQWPNVDRKPSVFQVTVPARDALMLNYDPTASAGNEVTWTSQNSPFASAVTLARPTEGRPYNYTVPVCQVSPVAPFWGGGAVTIWHQRHIEKREYGGADPVHTHTTLTGAVNLAFGGILQLQSGTISRDSYGQFIALTGADTGSPSLRVAGLGCGYIPPGNSLDVDDGRWIHNGGTTYPTPAGAWANGTTDIVLWVQTGVRFKEYLGGGEDQYMKRGLHINAAGLIVGISEAAIEDKP
jgi:hypothetical protein